MMIVILKLLLASLLITAGNFALVMLWYSRFFFGKIYAAEMTSEDIEKVEKTPMLPKFVIEFGLGFVISFAALAVFVLPNFQYGFVTGLMLSIFVLLPIFISDKIWDMKKSWKIWGLVTMQRLVSITLVFALAGFANSLILPSL